MEEEYTYSVETVNLLEYAQELIYAAIDADVDPHTLADNYAGVAHAMQLILDNGVTFE